MSSSNGHSNGTPQRYEGKRASGAPQEVRTLCRAVLSGWISEPSKLADARAALLEVIQNPATRPGTKAIAAKAIAEIELQALALGLRLAEMDDKTERLDAGEPTDRVVYDVRIPEARRITD